jgi:fumarate reductase subunit C
MQSVTGLALAAFLALHTLFVGTLLLGPEAFDAIVRLTDLTSFFGHPLLLHLRGMRHLNSTLWYEQVVTGLLPFFLASVHLYAIITQPDRISAEFAVRRIVDERAWLL